jgi:hypothetical protein
MEGKERSMGSSGAGVMTGSRKTTYKKISQTRKCYKKSFKEEDSFVAFELKTPPTVTVTLIAESPCAS